MGDGRTGRLNDTGLESVGLGIIPVVPIAADSFPASHDGLCVSWRHPDTRR